MSDPSENKPIGASAPGPPAKPKADDTTSPESSWSEYLEKERRTQEQLSTAQVQIGYLTQGVVRWLLDNPSSPEKVQVLEIQERLAELNNLVARRLKRSHSPDDGPQWSATVAQVRSLLKKTDIGSGELADQLPRELPGQKTEKKHQSLVPGDLPTLHEFRYQIGTLTQKQAAGYLGCNPRTIRNYLRKGELTKAKGGRVSCDDKWSKKIRAKYPAARVK